MNAPYFPPGEGAPAPLRAAASRQVRFEEVDSLGIVWHGRYSSYFEDARVALGDRFGIGYMDFYRNGVAAPIRKLHVDYFLPLRFQETFTIEAILHWTEACRLNIEFVLRNRDGAVATTGYTVQMMLDAAGNLLLVPPPFYREFMERWRRGEFA
ncbi:MAG: thioesterase superfamily protein [Deltaproteobacteria bacterium]|nr:thioesterase superfamily protein [Deltaproteobacteria bacterium]